MDHTTAIRSMAVEKYLLDEFDSNDRDAFEEHFFSCDECAQEVRAGAALMEHGREIFTRERETQRATGREAERQSSASRAKPRKRDWFAWLTPPIAVPAMAFMLGVLVFQNLVQFPALHQTIAALNSPALLPPPLYLASGSARTGSLPAVTANAGKSFLLLIDIPDKNRAAHLAELYDSAGHKQWSLAIPENAAKDSLPLQIPSGNDPSGVYTLVLRSAVPGQISPEVAKYSFELKRP